MVQFSGFPGNRQDWISIAKAGSKDNEFITWLYTEGRPSGTLSFDGLTYGDYEIRGYFNNEYIVRARQPFRIGSTNTYTTIKTQQPVYAPQEKIVVELSGFPGNRQDWISIAKAGDADNAYIVYQYLDGKQNGTLTFDGLQYG